MNYRGRTIKIATMVSAKEPVLKGQNFQGCHIEGPAVLFLGEDVVMEANTFGLPDGNVETMLWEIGPNRPVTFGAIQVQRCRFEDCTFKEIGFTGTAATLDLFRSDLG